jgi:hypothetical protein
VKHRKAADTGNVPLAMRERYAMLAWATRDFLCDFARRIQSKTRIHVTHRSEELLAVEAGRFAPVAPDTPAHARAGHHTAPGNMTSLAIFPENEIMEMLAGPGSG